MDIQTLQTKKIALLGLGVEGLSTATYFLKHGVSFAVIDEKTEKELLELGKEWEEGIKLLKKQKIVLQFGKPLTKDILSPFDMLIRSPGISLRKEYLQSYKGIISSQTKLFLSFCKGNIIGVTGTKGKGTTASLIYEMLKNVGKDAYIGGNIGKPSFDFLDDLTSASYSVLELSSFQLVDVEKSPHIAVMLMVTNEHVEFHGDTKAYHEAKRNIFRFQTADDMAILNMDYQATVSSSSITPGKVQWVSRFQEAKEGCFVRDNKVILRENGFEEEVIDTSSILLLGAHNLENVCAAVLVAHHCGVDVGFIKEVLQTFKGLEHRLEFVEEVGGVKYYDDSIATNPESTIAAIQAFSQPKILILGGVTEGSDFTKLISYISQDQSIKTIVGVGSEWSNFKAMLRKNGSTIPSKEGGETMKEIVRVCRESASPGDIVLLSPACKSFDMFKSYKDRGNQFKAEVHLL